MISRSPRQFEFQPQAARCVVAMFTGERTGRGGVLIGNTLPPRSVGREVLRSSPHITGIDGAVGGSRQLPRFSPVHLCHSPNPTGLAAQYTLLFQTGNDMATIHSHIHGKRSDLGGILLALFLILTGAVVLLRNFGVLWIDRIWDLWPLALIAAGLAGIVDWFRNPQT